MSSEELKVLQEPSSSGSGGESSHYLWITKETLVCVGVVGK